MNSDYLQNGIEFMKLTTQEKTKVFAVRLLAVLFVALVFGQVTANNTAAETFKTRCGWFVNPTPANAWLYDRDGEWIIGIQGGHTAEGDWPAFKSNQWVETNGSYGYGCACFQLKAHSRTREVSEIKKSYARPLSVCRKDKVLKEPK
jgi:hypothetical protein